VVLRTADHRSIGTRKTVCVGRGTGACRSSIQAGRPRNKRSHDTKRAALLLGAPFFFSSYGEEATVAVAINANSMVQHIVA